MHASLLPPEPLRGFVVRVSVAGRTFERQFSKEQSIEVAFGLFYCVKYVLNTNILCLKMTR